MGDNEGSSFVPSGNSLWLADDGKKRIYELDPATGALKRTIARRVFDEARSSRSGQFPVDSYQPLSSGADYTAAAWSPTDEKVYLGKGRSS
jgi:DNA-binding beta-propeller fold protein YncE